MGWDGMEWLMDCARSTDSPNSANKRMELGQFHRAAAVSVTSRARACLIVWLCTAFIIRTPCTLPVLDSTTCAPRRYPSDPIHAADVNTSLLLSVHPPHGCMHADGDILTSTRSCVYST